MRSLSGKNPPDEIKVIAKLRELNVLIPKIFKTTKINKVEELYYIEEPSQVSNNVKKMRGKLIIKPEITFKSADLNVYAFNLKDNKFCFNNINFYHELMNEIRININNGTFDQFFDEYIAKL